MDKIYFEITKNDKRRNYTFDYNSEVSDAHDVSTVASAFIDFLVKTGVAKDEKEVGTVFMNLTKRYMDTGSKDSCCSCDNKCSHCAVDGDCEENVTRQSKESFTRAFEAFQEHVRKYPPYIL